MAGPFDYSIIPRSDYSAPVCRVHLSLGDRTLDHDAIIDSGADVTCIQEWMVKELLLKQVTTFEVAGVKGGDDDQDENEEVPIEEDDEKSIEARPGYLVDLDFLGFPYRALIVASVKGPTDHILIGRDVLNFHKVTLSGLELTYTVE